MENAKKLTDRSDSLLKRIEQSSRLRLSTVQRLLALRVCSRGIESEVGQSRSALNTRDGWITRLGEGKCWLSLSTFRSQSDLRIRVCTVAVKIFLPIP